MKFSKQNVVTVLAHKRGYRISELGEAISPKGRVLKGGLAHGYRCFTMRVRQSFVAVRFHQLMAYQKFGRAAFKADCVRHLNGVPTDNRAENIAIGSYQENAGDVPKEAILYASKLGVEKILRSDWAEIDAERAKGTSYRKLATMFPVAKSTLSYRYSKKPSKGVIK